MGQFEVELYFDVFARDFDPSWDKITSSYKYKGHDGLRCPTQTIDKN
jgi:hypothetical protein